MSKILVVDDSETLRSQIKEILEEAQFEVLEAQNGLDGLEVIGEHSDLALILCDVNMPEMDGLTMCEQIEERGLGNVPPIFMLTTESSKEMKSRGKAAGVMAWVTKPFVAEKLIKAVNKVLGL